MAPPMPGVPSHVNNYLRVEDVDASTAAAVANGGTCAVPATDIPPGRFSVITSPSGAMVSLFKESDPSSQDHPADDKGFHWIELHSTDIDADVAFLKATFSFDVGEMPMPNGATYYLLNDGDTQVSSPICISSALQPMTSVKNAFDASTLVEMIPCQQNLWLVYAISSLPLQFRGGPRWVFQP
ncbi:MAG: hypothetical protein GY913_17470 [Proteobacteria bacterium]|nr:hypothetical protein [Pseudomonadota bacterium]MCP4918697.1 hypothetical protein [Pseudomonadota bacterium]